MTILDDMFGTEGTMDFLKDNFFEMNAEVSCEYLWIFPEFWRSPILESDGLTAMKNVDRIKQGLHEACKYCIQNAYSLILWSNRYLTDYTCCLF